MLKITLNRLKPQIEEVSAEEQARFRAGRSISDPIFKFRILSEKYLKHQQNLYMSSLISKKPLTEYGMQPYGPPCRSKISVKTCTNHKLEIGAKKTKLMTNSTNGIQREMMAPEQATAALTKLKLIWRDNSVSLGL